MVEPIAINVRHLSQDVRIPQEQVQAAIELLDSGLPVPFIARYRKEVTLNISEESLRTIEAELRSVRILCERKLTILKTMEFSGKLTPELDKSIREAKSLKRLEDIYAPFKPKRQRSAASAIENGLEPFALEILEGKVLPDKMDERAAEFINEDKKIKSVADVLLGAGHIIADIFGSRVELIQKVRDLFYQQGQLLTTKIEPAKSEQANSPATDTAIAKDTPAQTIDSQNEPAAADTLADTGNMPEIPSTEAETADGDALDDESANNESANNDDVADDVVADGDSSVPEIASTEIIPASEEQTADSDGDTQAVSDELLSEDIPSGEDSNEGDASNEVTELFEQLKEEQAEKGIPKVISQNTLRKKKRAEAKKKLDEIKQRQREHFSRQFSEYFNFSTKLRGVPAHRILAFNRGEKHNIIKIELKIDEAKLLESVKDLCVPGDHPHAEFLTGCLQNSLHRSVVPMLSREIRNDMTEYAEKHSVKNFAHNLRTMLLHRPLAWYVSPARRVLALDPGGKHGCIAVALDEFGNLLGNETIFLAGSAGRKADSAKTLAEMIRRFNLSVVVIGIGGGSRMAEETVALMIETHFAEDNLQYALVHRAGSVAYSTSSAAKEDLPFADPFVRAAVSLGRRAQDPMCELAKMEPSTLGQGVFQLDPRAKHIKQMLEEVVESCVNLVGLDLNRATPALLTHVAGLNIMTARRICEYRREHGRFSSREDLKKVPGINETVYKYAAGFLRISDVDNPLDATHIHPESYQLAADILEKLGYSANDLSDGDRVKAIANTIAEAKIGELTVKFSTELNAGINTVRDILEELSRPGRDPRRTQPPIVFRKKPLKLEDLTAGMELTGTILNVTDFGAFADIGLPESGFIHISQMASGYIQNAHERLAVGNTVRLWVVESDGDKKRVALTLLPPGIERQPQRQPGRERRDGTEHPSRERHVRPPKPDADRRESTGRPQRDSDRNTNGGRRFDKHKGGRPMDRTPRTFVSTPTKKESKPITEQMKQGKEPMRSFSDLAQMFGRAQSEQADDNKKGKQ